MSVRALSLPVLLGLLLAGCGGSGGPSSFVGTASNAAVYVTWTRSDDALSGQLTQAMAPEQVDGEVQTNRVGFSGTVSGEAVSLRLEQGLGTSSTLTGSLDGDTLSLDYPGADGGVTAIKLHRGDSAAFNDELAALRGRVADTKQQADEQAAQDEIAADAAAAVENVNRLIDGLAAAAENATASNPGLYDSDLDTIRSGLDTAKSSHELFQSDQANGYRENYCDDASTLADDVANMRHDIRSMRHDVKANTDASLISEDIQNLRDQFATQQNFDPALLGPDAATREDVEDAIRAARRKVSQSGGADFATAEKLLDQAKSLQADAQAACDRTHG